MLRHALPAVLAAPITLLTTGLAVTRAADHLDGIPDDTVLFNAGTSALRGQWTLSYTRVPPDPFHSGDRASGGSTFFNDPAMTPNPNRPLVGDIDGDGVADLVRVASNGFQELFVGVLTPVHDGFGTLPDPAGPIVWTGMDASSFGFFLADVNGDGRDDPLTVRDSGGTMLWESIHSQPGGLGFQAGDTSYAFFGPVTSAAGQGTAQSPNLPLTGDFDGDGRADVGFRIASDADAAPGYILTILSGAAGLRDPTINEVVQGFVANVVDDQTGEPRTVATLVGDLNGDGLDDIVEVDNRWQDGNYLYAGGLTGPSGEPSGFSIAPNGITWSAPFGAPPAGALTNVPLLADFNGDGRDDLVVYREFTAAGGLTAQWLVSFTRPGGSLFESTFDQAGEFTLTRSEAGNRPLVGQFKRCAAAAPPCCSDPFADADGDGDADGDDFGRFQACYTGEGGGVPEGCRCFDRDNAGEGDGDIDTLDFTAFQQCAGRAAVPPNPACDG